MAITNQFLERVFSHANQGSRMDRRGLWVDLRKGLEMAAERIVPWRGKRSTIVNKQMLRCQSLWFYLLRTNIQTYRQRKFYFQS